VGRKDGRGAEGAEGETTFELLLVNLSGAIRVEELENFSKLLLLLIRELDLLLLRRLGRHPSSILKSLKLAHPRRPLHSA